MRLQDTGQKETGGEDTGGEMGVVRRKAF